MGARIVLIEDNPDNLELMSYLLAAYGHAVVKATDGAAGLEAARREPPDLVLCDLQLPGMDGLEVVRCLRQVPVLHGVPLVAVTAYAMVGDRDRILRAGFDGYLSKPIEPTRFVGQVESYLPAGLRTGGGPPEGPPQPALGEPVFAEAPGTGAGAARPVLVVDDLPENLSLFRAILEPHGFRVLAASGGTEALAMARRERPSLILSDIHMERGSGLDLLRAIRTDPDLADTPLVLVTATGKGTRSRAEAEREGATGFLASPLEPESLLAEVRRYVRPRGG